MNLHSVTDELQSHIIFIKLYMNYSLTEAWGLPDVLKHSQKTRCKVKPFVPGLRTKVLVCFLAMQKPNGLRTLIRAGQFSSGFFTTGHPFINLIISYILFYINRQFS